MKVSSICLVLSSFILNMGAIGADSLKVDGDAPQQLLDGFKSSVKKR